MDQIIKEIMRRLEIQTKALAAFTEANELNIRQLQEICPHSEYEDMYDPTLNRYQRCKFCHMRKS